MADSNIGALPQVPQLNDDSLLVVEQQGQAMKVTGAQFKEFGRQAVVGQVQGYVDAAQAAASEAVDAVSAVTDMTVEACALAAGQEASVSKSTQNGRVHLTFGLPRGEQGIPGPEGPAGARGPRGETGKGLTILGHYNTELALRVAVTAPAAGDAYSVGEEAPYEIYIFDSVSLDWINYGPLSGGGGGTILPENVVTTPGGAELEFSSGDGPHTVTFTFEEEPPLTAEDIIYSEDQTVKEAMDGLFTSVSDGKALIASAITDKGVPTAQDAAFADMAEHIGQITAGGDTSDATATPGDILSGKTAYTASGKVEGLIPSLAAQTIIPGTANKTIANGQYLSGTQTIKGDPNLTSSNIKKGVSIFGVAGAVEQNFLATLTVTADIGAVVTATHSSGTSVEGLSTNGSVTLELPLEGTWSVTAQRGMAQYNTVVIEVTSQYNASLTAEVHIEYYGTADWLSSDKLYMAATSIDGYAIFAGGNGDSINESRSVLYEYKKLTSVNANADSYNKNLVRTAIEKLSVARAFLSAIAIGDHAIFAGGRDSVNLFDTVDVYGKSLERTTIEPLSKERSDIAAAFIGNYALFGGGATSRVVDAYNRSLTHTIPEILATHYGVKAAENENNAIFGASTHSSAYNSSLTKTDAVSLSFIPEGAVRAGNYVLFVSSGGAVEAYDLFLTKTIAESSSGRLRPSTITLNGFGLIHGYNLSRYADSISIYMDIYDPFLVKTTLKDSDGSTQSYGMSAALAGEFALFGGGYIPAIKKATSSVTAFHYV